MGAAVGAAVRGEVLWASEGRSGATAARATGFEDVGTAAELVSRSDVVLSICPPGLAEDVAQEVAEHGFGRCFVDANAISPARAERIATLFDRAIDGSITAKTGIHLFLSGEPGEVELACGLFGEPVVPTPLPGGVGAASALKMAFAGWNKIGAVLEAQAYAVARAYGLEGCARRGGRQPRPHRTNRSARVALDGRDARDRRHARGPRAGRRDRPRSRRLTQALDEATATTRMFPSTELLDELRQPEPKL